MNVITYCQTRGGVFTFVDSCRFCAWVNNHIQDPFHVCATWNYQNGPVLFINDLRAEHYFWIWRTIVKISRTYFGVICLVLLALAVCLGPTVTQAQSTTQGAIAGTVLDQSQAAVPNAAISIQNAATGFGVQLASDTSGYFKAPLLEPGIYTVTISAANFARYRVDSVTVQVGQTTTVNPILSVASSTTEVVVTEQSPIMNMESPDFTGTLTTQALQSIPINNRRWSSLAMTTPGVVSDASGYGLVSVRGISTLLNNVEIDGADDNQAFFSEERGRTREAYSTSANAVREFAVNTGVYSAQYGRAAGGVITSVTKSGTNQIHGQAYLFDRQSNWNAYNNFTKVTNFVNGSSVSSVIKPKDLRKIYGFTAGGPLIKDKLFWIYTYDQHSHVFPVVGIPYNPTQFYTLPQASLSTGETCNTTTGLLTGAPSGNVSLNDANACALAARQQISYTQASYDWAAMLYGSNTVSVTNYPGATAITDVGLNSDIGQVARLGYQEINTPKIDHGCRQLCSRFAGQRLRQTRLRRYKAHHAHHQQHQQRSPVSVWPRA
jgi:Carboxypeptidase regulatory-like domain/TonB-dependent Receptor Plug Domain